MEVDALPIWWSILLIGVLSVVMRLLNKYWFEPRRIRSVLLGQGIRGPRPTFPFGNVSEMQKIQSTMINKTHEGCDGQQPVNHDWFPSVFPAIHQWEKEYGRIYMYSIGANQHLYVSDPKLLMEIKQHNSLDLGKPIYLGKPLRPLLGDNGLLRNNGKHWAVQRKLLAPEFFLGKVKGMVDVMVESTRELIKTWETQILESKSGIVDMKVDEELKTLSSDIISRACFGSSYILGNQIFEKIAYMVDELWKPSLQFGFHFSWILPNKKLWNLRKEVDDMLLKLVRDRQAERELGGAPENDLLQMLLNIATTSIDMPAHRRKAFVLDNCRQIYFASSATTSLTASWTLMLLSLHPEWLERMRSEIVEVCGGLDKVHHYLHDMDTLRKFKVLTMVIQESMRLYASGVLIARATLANVKLGDLNVPKGTNIHVGTATLHRDPENWGADANEFKPERFANGINNACKYPQAYVPFGFGTRLCIGQTFAMTQLKIVLSLILCKFSFSLSPNYRHSLIHKTILMPKHGISLLVKSVQAN